MKLFLSILLAGFFLVGCASSHIQVSSSIPQGQNISIQIETTDSEE